MGNYRFRLSDMMPNSWFYKLKEMGRATRTQTIHPNSNRINHHFRTPSPPPPPSTTAATANESKSSESSALQQKQVFLPNRHSYYFPSREKTDMLSSSPSHPKGSDTHFPIHLPRETSTNTQRNAPINPSSNPPSPVSSATDIIIDFDELSVHRLRPILTKPAKKEATKNCELLDAKQVMLRKAQQRIRRMKVKACTPKVEIKKVKEYSRSRRMVNCKRLISESFVVLKKSHDPKRDFKESMVEMIVENDIRGCKDLEELLVCYLSLNSVDYHDLIVKVFQEIWIDLTEFIHL